MSDESKRLMLDWAAVRPEREEGEEAPPRTPHFSEADLIIRTSRDRILVVVHPDGTHEFGPEYTPDEAAVTFWEAMGRRRLGAEDRLLVIEHMERLLVRLGRQDLRTEQLRREAMEEQDPRRKQALELTAQNEIRRLEMYNDQVIELARGLARRGLEAPQVPAQVPQSIQDDPESNYRGREALPVEEGDEEVEQRPTVPEAPQSRPSGYTPSPITTVNPPAPVVPVQGGGETANPPAIVTPQSNPELFDIEGPGANPPRVDPDE